MTKLSLFAYLMLSLTTGCKNPAVKTVATNAINCAEAQIKPLAAALMPSVEGLLVGTTPNWDTTLGALLDVAGAAGACAVNSAVKVAESKISNVDIARAAPPPAIVKNGRNVIKARNLHFVTVDDETPPTQ